MFLEGADPANIVLQCVDGAGPLLTLLDAYYLLTESDLAPADPTYWSLGPAPAR